MKRIVAYIALGSNLGHRGKTLRSALDMLRATAGVMLKRVSTLIETEPAGGPAEQGKYLNGVAQIETSLTPQQLLTELHRIEAALGRDRNYEQRFGPRTCDLDIILFGDLEIDTPDLTIPHPRMLERTFVLRPLVEIAPDTLHPANMHTARELLTELERSQ